MGWVVSTPVIGVQPIATTSTTQNHPLGFEVEAYHETYRGGTFVYAKGVASTAVGSAVLISPDDYSTTLLNADDIGPVGFAMSANVANQYGWYQRRGKAVGKVLASFADNGRVYATSTDGSVDDAVVDGDLVHNCLGASAIDTPSTGLAELEIDRPYCDDIAGND